ncbi:MAG: rod-binding protein [Fuerstiella sp.]
MESIVSHAAAFSSDPLSALSGRTQDGSEEELQKVAKQFESVFVSMMLKSMRESMSKDMFEGDSSDTFGGLFDSFLGEHIAEHGGFGLAEMVLASGASVLGAGTETPVSETPVTETPGTGTPGTGTLDGVAPKDLPSADSLGVATPLEISNSLKAYQHAYATR